MYVPFGHLPFLLRKKRTLLCLIRQEGALKGVRHEPRAEHKDEPQDNLVKD